MKEQYRIDYRNFEGFKAQIAKLNVRCAKLRVPAIVIRELSVEEKKVKNEFTQVVARVYRWHVIELEGAQPKFQGWTLAAVVEHAEEGNLLRKAPGCSVDLVGFRQGAPRCDHCKAIRNRKDTYIVLHERGDQKMIGSNCIKDFLGHRDPHMLAKWAEICFSAGEMAGGAEDFDGCGGGRVQELANCRTVIALANAAIRNKGFVSGKAAHQAYEERGQSLDTTAGFVRTAMHPRHSGQNPDVEGEDYFLPIDQDFEIADKAIAYILDTLGTQDAEKLNDFEHNLLMVAKCHNVEERNIGLLAYVPQYYARSLERAAEKANKAPEAYFGKVGTRYKGIELTYNRSTGWDSRYGYTYLHMFSGPNGERMTWKTGNDLGLEPGAKVVATFTIKAHEVYKDTLQTKITRAKI